MLQVYQISLKLDIQQFLGSLITSMGLHFQNSITTFTDFCWFRKLQLTCGPAPFNVFKLFILMAEVYGGGAGVTPGMAA